MSAPALGHRGQQGWPRTSTSQAYSFIGVEMSEQGITGEHKECSGWHVQDALGEHSRERLAQNQGGHVVRIIFSGCHLC